MNASRWLGVTWFLLRVVSGLLFWQHGAQKLFGWFGGMGGQGGTAPLMSLMGLAGILEFYGGLAIALGLFTRPIAFLLSGQMAVAYWKSHAPQSAWPIENRGELAALYCFLFLFMCTHGSGPWSLDSLLGRRRLPAAGAS